MLQVCKYVQFQNLLQTRLRTYQSTIGRLGEENDHLRKQLRMVRSHNDVEDIRNERLRLHSMDDIDLLERFQAFESDNASHCHQKALMVKTIKILLQYVAWSFPTCYNSTYSNTFSGHYYPIFQNIYYFYISYFICNYIILYIYFSR